MMETKNARPSVAAPGQAVEPGTNHHESPVSNTKFTTPGGTGQSFSVANLLPTGQQNAIPLRHLKDLTGLPGRELRRLIQLERKNGALILSDNLHGYYLAADKGEVQAFVRSMRHRAAEVRLTAMYVERWAMDHG